MNLDDALLCLEEHIRPGMSVEVWQTTNCRMVRRVIFNDGETYADTYKKFATAIESVEAIAEMPTSLGDFERVVGGDCKTPSTFIELQKDAARYRWLTNDCDGNLQDDFTSWLAKNVASKDDIDAKIDESRAYGICLMGVGCGTTGICYAEKNGHLEQCGKPVTLLSSSKQKGSNEELKIGDKIKDNDPRMGKNRVLEIIEVRPNGVMAVDSMGKARGYLKKAIHTDGKVRRTGFSLVHNFESNRLAATNATDGETV